jgi:hypothetical protein
MAITEPSTEAATALDRPRFAVKDCTLIAIATGKRAHTLKEFRDHIAEISPDSLYYHFLGNLLQARFEEREYNNDFAAWAHRSLHDAKLAEQLAVVDPAQSANMTEIRRHLLEYIEERLEKSEHLHWVIATQPFEFIRSQIVVFNAHIPHRLSGQYAGGRSIAHPLFVQSTEKSPGNGDHREKFCA